MVRTLTVAAALSLMPMTAFAQTIAGGDRHTIVLKSDGTVWAFGLNDSGQLGDNTTTARTAPIQVSGLSGIVAVAAGASHSMALTSTGNLYVWGLNSAGQIGDATTTSPRKTPVQSNLTNVVAIDAGAYHSVALTSSGDVYTWGKNASGQLGNGTTTASTTPVLVMTGVAAIGAGFDHTLFVKTNGTVFASGSNAYGQLGDGTTTSPRSTPVQMSGITTATAATGGELHSVILLSDGTLKATGYNGYGTIGDGTTTQRTTAVAVSTLTNITAIAAGANHVIARESDGTAWTWGNNYDGQIGNGIPFTSRTSPFEIAGLSSITNVGAGRDHTMAVTSSGVVYTWGDNSGWQLGDGSGVDRSLPTAISDPGYDWRVSTPPLNISAGTYNTDRSVVIAITTPGATIRYTQNGNEPSESDTAITSGSSVTVSTSQTLKAKAFKSGMAASTTAAATYEMKVATIAYAPNSGTYASAQAVTMSSATPGTTIRYTTDGSTPTESSTVYSSPISVATMTTLKAVGFKSNWTSSILTTGNYTMNFGTLAAPSADQATGSYINSVTVTLTAMSGATIRYTADGSTPTSTSTPYSVPLAFDVTTTLKAKAYHPDYLTSAETSRTYTLAAAAPTLSPTGGTYVAGQLVTVTAVSIGSTLRYTINGVEPTTSDPVIASGGTLVAGNYTLKVKAWKTAATPSAVAMAAYTVTGDVTAPAIAAGADHSLAIRGDSVSWGWGYNAAGQIGDGTTISPRLLPRIVSGLTGAVAATAGGVHSLELLSNGTPVAFGFNSNGRLGDGTTTAWAAPVSLAALTGMVAMAAGDDHSLGLKGDGSVLAWGFNSYGQLGDGSTTQRLNPTAVSTITSISAISAGYHYSLALKQNGTVWAWGDNDDGQLGDGTRTDRTAPVQVADITTATAIAAGRFHTLAILADGTVRAWGDNAGGSLGDGTTTDRLTPVAVAGLTDVVGVAAGTSFSLALKSDGTLWSWGANSYGQLGDGTTTVRSSAAQVSGLSGIVKIAAGGGHVLALANDGTVYAWGNNYYGQLGDGTTTNRLTPVAISGPDMNWRVPTPTVSLASGQYFSSQSATVTSLDPDATLRYTTTGVDPVGTDATVVSGGSIAIDQSQTLKVSGWRTAALTSVVVARTYELKAVTPTMTPGAGAYGSAQTVSITSTTSGATLRYTTDGTEPTTSSATYTAAMTVSDTQTVKARAYKTGWTSSESGHASYWVSGGTVATPTMTPSGGAHTTPPLVSISSATSGATIRFTLDGSTPTGASSVFVYPFVVPVTTTITAKAFKAGFTASAVATVTYAVDAAGAAATPSIVPAGGVYVTTRTVTITGASGTTLRYTTDGVDPTTSSATIASGGTLSVAASQIVKVRAWVTGLTPSAVRRADFVITGAVSAGNLHSAALTSAGTIWTWGYNYFGQLGDGSYTARLTPVSVLTGAVAVSAGDRHTLAVKADGSAWSWGDGSNGRTGGGGAATPAPIPGLTNVVAVAAGFQHSLALKADGTVWAFGANYDGQLGDGTTSQRTTPVRVVGLTGVVAIAAGRDVSYALQTDSAGSGTVWAWGVNTSGQLGDESSLSRTTPTKVVGLTKAVQVSSSAGAFGAVALTADGRVVTWGQNLDGQLGLGSTTLQRSAQEVPVLRSVRQVAAGTRHMMAVDATARSWGWGDNTAGQLGTGDSVAADSIVPERSNLGGALAITAGEAHTLAVSPDGSVRAFGSNGALGNGTTTASATPIVVSGLSLAANTWLMGDPDADALETWREYLLGTDPLNADSNGNGILDGLDDASGVSATNPDTDGDGVPNWIEQATGTDPFRADSDGDGVSDGADAFPLDPTRSMAPSSNPSDTTPPLVTLKAPVSARPVP